jgi:enolase-phosphatase E1
LNQSVSGLLLDVEGTTTPIDFVYRVLFPYALSHAGEFLKRNLVAPDVRLDLEGLRKEHQADVDVLKGLAPPPLRADDPDAEIESVVTYIGWLTEQDRKSTSFKSLQGKIWQEGYRSGRLRAEVFEDVPRALKRWRDQKKSICIFSSGSVQAQKLLFAHTVAGDLSEHISGYFDTTTGSKTDAHSYQKIVHAFPKQPSEILFVSDVTAELDAARAAGLETALCVRPGNRPQPVTSHSVIATFDEVFPERASSREA